MLPQTPEQTAYHNACLKALFEPLGFTVDGHMVYMTPWGRNRPIDCSCIDVTDIKSAMTGWCKLSHDNSYRLGEDAMRKRVADHHTKLTDLLELV